MNPKKVYKKFRENAKLSLKWQRNTFTLTHRQLHTHTYVKHLKHWHKRVSFNSKRIKWKCMKWEKLKEKKSIVQATRIRNENVQFS